MKKLTDAEKLFLRIIKASLQGDHCAETHNSACWKAVSHLASSHSILPLLCEAIYDNESFISFSGSDAILDRAVKQSATQIVRSEDFLDLYDFFRTKDLFPIVMKGALLRGLYPVPEERISADEDLFIDEADFPAFHQMILSFGLTPVFPGHDPWKEHEVAYIRKETGLYIEVHKNLFPPDSKAYGDLNRFFDDSIERAVTVQVSRFSDLQRAFPVEIKSMCPTDHIFYMLCHAYKHFLHGGIGIRQVCDIVLYAHAERSEIDWDGIYDLCVDAGMKGFAGALFRIGDVYLLEEPLNILSGTGWLNVDEISILKDIIDGGVYGVSSKARVHSSNITLGAVENEKDGHRTSSVLHAVFLPVENLSTKYPYLNKAPFLLPIAWIQRVVGFLAEGFSNRDKGIEALDTVALGKERIALFREYGILKGDAGLQNTDFNGPVRRLYHRVADSVISPLFRPAFYVIASVEYLVLNTLWLFQGHHPPAGSDQKLVRDNVTFIFKSFERQGMSRQLCANISRLYPGVRIIVADDSHTPLTVLRRNVRVIQMPFNSGLSAGIAEALKHVKTPYLVRLDDDELLTLRSNVHGELLYLMDHPKLDLIGFGIMTAIRCRDARKNFEIYMRSSAVETLRPNKLPHLMRLDDDHVVMDKVFNLYIARTDQVKMVGFDPNIRMVDHSEFFWRASGIITSAAALNTVVWHRHNPFDHTYKKYRSDYKQDLTYIREKTERMLKEESFKRSDHFPVSF